MVSGKTGLEKTPPQPEHFMQLFDNFSEYFSFLVPFWRPLDFEGAPQIDSFSNKSKTNYKNEVQETGWKQHDLLIDV